MACVSFVHDTLPLDACTFFMYTFAWFFYVNPLSVWSTACLSMALVTLGRVGARLWVGQVLWMEERDDRWLCASPHLWHTCSMSEESFVRPLSRARWRGEGRSWGCEGNLKREDVILRLPNILGSHLCSLALGRSQHSHNHYICWIPPDWWSPELNAQHFQLSFSCSTQFHCVETSHLIFLFCLYFHMFLR